MPITQVVKPMVVMNLKLRYSESVIGKVMTQYIRTLNSCLLPMRCISRWSFFVKPILATSGISAHSLLDRTLPLSGLS